MAVLFDKGPNVLLFESQQLRSDYAQRYQALTLADVPKYIGAFSEGIRFIKI